MTKFIVIEKLSYLILIILILGFIGTLLRIIGLNFPIHQIKQLIPLLYVGNTYFMSIGTFLRIIKAKPIADETLKDSINKAGKSVIIGIILTCILVISLMCVK